MAKLKLRNKELQKLGFPKGKLSSLAINVVYEHFRRQPHEWVLAMLEQVLARPADFKATAGWERIAQALLNEQGLAEGGGAVQLHAKTKPFAVFGQEHIEAGAMNQMYLAMRLPIAVEGALMPDAHQGYGLPIGGVLATEKSVIPYGVGVDIGCRMCLSLFDLPVQHLLEKRDFFAGLLQAHTRFGQQAFDRPLDDPIFEQDAFRYLKIARDNRDKAWKQIGSSGGGNHFVEFGKSTISDANNSLGIPTGDYLAVLSHSGSRGLGAKIAQYYTSIAMKQSQLPKEASHLAWLMLDSQAGHEYWSAMNLAGDYATACHDHIHRRLAKALGEKAIARVENHHNFAWKEQLADGREVIVHRKGATPAGKGVLGVIPGSMTAPGYIVQGRGHIGSLNSASHGAGRVLSRGAAKKSLTEKLLKEHLRQHHVSLIGGGLDEAPMAYKDIHAVMAAQSDLVDIIGTFQPVVVRMAGAGEGED
ncbi:MAG TPA: RtcB family protein [Saprospiraceae bacterium]|nr:RtcB family protein [Saprospiraceae bacterium]HMQ84232.1 RtcB family protein [Saprospiraceae bacterium]